MARTKKTTATAYDISIEIGKDIFNFEADSVKAALLDFKPTTCKAKVLFVITKGDKKFNKVVLPKFARRIFSNEVFAEVFSNNVTRVIG